MLVWHAVHSQLIAHYPVSLCEIAPFQRLGSHCLLLLLLSSGAWPYHSERRRTDRSRRPCADTARRGLDPTPGPDEPVRMSRRLLQECRYLRRASHESVTANERSFGRPRTKGVTRQLQVAGRTGWILSTSERTAWQMCIVRPVYTCDFWCDFRCDFMYKNTREASRGDRKESYHILFEDTLLSNFRSLGGILSQRYATRNPCWVG